MRRYALRDDQWERIRDLLPGREGDWGATAEDNRLFVEAEIVIARAFRGARLARSVFGDWKNVHRGSAAGPSPVLEKRCSSISRSMPTTSMR